MKEEINLVAKKQGRAKNLKRLLTTSVIVFSITFILAASLIGYVFLLKSDLSALTLQEQELKNNLSNFSAKKEKVLVVRERLTNINSLLKTRKNLDTKLNSILAIIDDNFSFNGISATDERIGITIASNRLADFDNLLEEEIAREPNSLPEDVERVNITSFSNTANGYVLSLDFYFTDVRQGNR